MGTVTLWWAVVTIVTGNTQQYLSLLLLSYICYCQQYNCIERCPGNAKIGSFVLMSRQYILMLSSV